MKIPNKTYALFGIVLFVAVTLYTFSNRFSGDSLNPANPPQVKITSNSLFSLETESSTEHRSDSQTASFEAIIDRNEIFPTSAWNLLNEASDIDLDTVAEIKLRNLILSEMSFEDLDSELRALNAITNKAVRAHFLSAIADRYIQSGDLPQWEGNDLPDEAIYFVYSRFLESYSTIDPGRAYETVKNLELHRLSDSAVNAVADGLLEVGEIRAAREFYDLAPRERKDAIAYTIAEYGMRANNLEMTLDWTAQIERQTLQATLLNRITKRWPDASYFQADNNPNTANDNPDNSP